MEEEDPPAANQAWYAKGLKSSRFLQAEICWLRNEIVLVSVLVVGYGVSEGAWLLRWISSSPAATMARAAKIKPAPKRWSWVRGWPWRWKKG